MRITVAKAICELDVAKATGNDCIPSIVLSICSSELSPVFVKLYNKSLLSHFFYLVGNFPLLYWLTKMMVVLYNWVGLICLIESRRGWST